MSRAARLRLYLRVARAEGLRATLARVAERLDERRARRACRPVSAAVWRDGVRGVSVLNLLPSAPAARLGGVQIAFARRLAVEEHLRACALLHPERGGWRLEARAAGVALHLADEPLATAARDRRFEALVRRALESSGATALHVENAAGLPLDSLACLAEEGLPLIVSLHDFAPFCPRPLLIEQPCGRFCGYVRDAARCGACLATDGRGDRGAVEALRGAGARLLRAARALVFPSEFLRARLDELVGIPAHVVQAVVAPSSGARLVPRSHTRRAGRHVAFVGAARAEKGAALFERVVEQLSVARPELRFSAYGGGGAALVRWRARGVRVHGHYRAGTLPERLAHDGVDVALLLSLGPESYGLTLDECVAAGVPSIVFDVGAPAERVRAWRAGDVVSLAAGAEGVMQALLGRLARRAAGGDAAGGVVAALPTPEDAARAHVALYGRLGFDAPAPAGAR